MRHGSDVTWGVITGVRPPPPRARGRMRSPRLAGAGAPRAEPPRSAAPPNRPARDEKSILRRENISDLLVARPVCLATVLLQECRSAPDPDSYAQSNSRAAHRCNPGEH